MFSIGWIIFAIVVTSIFAKLSYPTQVAVTFVVLFIFLVPASLLLVKFFIIPVWDIIQNDWVESNDLLYRILKCAYDPSCN